MCKVHYNSFMLAAPNLSVLCRIYRLSKLEGYFSDGIDDHRFMNLGTSQTLLQGSTLLAMLSAVAFGCSSAALGTQNPCSFS